MGFSNNIIVEKQKNRMTRALARAHTKIIEIVLVYTQMDLVVLWSLCAAVGDFLWYLLYNRRLEQ